MGDARRASPKSGRPVWACWVWARAQTQQAQSLGRHVVVVDVVVVVVDVVVVDVVDIVLRQFPFLSLIKRAYSFTDDI